MATGIGNGAEGAADQEFAHWISTPSAVFAVCGGCPFQVLVRTVKCLCNELFPAGLSNWTHTADTPLFEARTARVIMTQPRQFCVFEHSRTPGHVPARTYATIILYDLLMHSQLVLKGFYGIIRIHEPEGAPPDFLSYSLFFRKGIPLRRLFIAWAGLKLDQCFDTRFFAEFA